MSDNRKTWDEVISELPDNVVGLIGAVDVRGIARAAQPHVAALAPTVNDDNTKGFDVGTEWHTGSQIYKCRSNATGAAVWSQIWPVSAAPGSADWGQIGGTIGDQADLGDALAGKADASHDHDTRYYTETEVDNLLNGLSFAASDISYNNSSSGLSSTNVKAALDELDADVQNIGSVTGLTNPLTSNLDGASYILSDVLMAGFRDHYYDLDADVHNLVSAGTANLTGAHNAWYYGGLSSALEIKFPPVDSNSTGLFGIINVSLASGGSVTLASSPEWAWEKTSLSTDDPTIPTADGTSFAIRYRRDPVSNVYLLSMSVWETSSVPSEPGELTVVNTFSGAPTPESTTTSFQVNLPANIQADDVIVFAFGRAGTADTSLSTPSGWTRLYSIADWAVTSAVFYKKCVGNESSTQLTLTTTNPSRHAYIGYHLRGVDVSGTYIEGDEDWSLNPPEVTAPWGADSDNLWLTFAIVRSRDNTLSLPSNYTNPVAVVHDENLGTLSSSGYLRMLSGRRTATGATENPGSFGSTGTVSSPKAITVVLRPQ